MGDSRDGGDPGAAGRWRRAVAVVAAAALAVRGATGVWRGPELLQAGNGLEYLHALAQSVARGEGFQVDGVVNVFQQPLYVFALAAGYALLGPTWQAVLAVNALIGTALVVVTMGVARRLDERAALPAGVIAAVHPVLVWHGNSIADTTLFSLTLVGWFGATLAAMRGGGLRAGLAAGAWTGLAFLTRPSLLPLLPVGAVAIAAAQRAWRPALRYALLTFVVGGALTLPWLLRNHALTGVFPLIGTHGPESVWAANSEGSVRATELDSSYDAVSAQHDGTGFDVPDFQFRVPPEEGVRRERGFRDATAEWVRANPRDFAWMCAVRLGRMWDVRYHPMRRWERPLPGLRERNWVHALSHTPVLLLAAAGLVLLLRDPVRRPEALFLLAVLVVYSAAHAVGAGYTRVRVPVDPVLVALAGVAVAAWLPRRAGAGLTPGR